ncbi:MAG: VCBS repeat-containing protein [Clostridiales bacterium]|nr:VCBS repeat-containing protein [Clostridiales bacterium]
MKKIKNPIIVFLIVMLALSSVSAAEADDEKDLFEPYSESFKNVRFEEEITQNGFVFIETQVFTIKHEKMGELKLLPAIHKEFNRLAFFFASDDGYIVFKTDDFISNSWLKGQARQTNRDLVCLSFTDLNGDGLDDIIIISACRNQFGIYADKTYQVADVLFQSEEGFYRDPRISDKLNRFDMNKTLDAIVAFVRDGVSMEFLFTAKDLAELYAHGFRPISNQCFTEHFEKFGVVEIISGFFNLAGQNYLMIYITDTAGKILWNFQPMHYYVNFYAISSISFRDIDGDGNKDILLIGHYVTYDEDGLVIIKRDYDIYYQRAGYFLEDTQFKQSYSCGEDDDIGVITSKARQYWGWPQ